LIAHRHQISRLDPDAASLSGTLLRAKSSSMTVGPVRGHLPELRCLVVCAGGPDLLSLLGAADLAAVAWPVSGILVGWPIVLAGNAARSAAGRSPVCIAIAIHGGFMR
jgi:hypothetical protein